MKERAVGQGNPPGPRMLRDLPGEAEQRVYCSPLPDDPASLPEGVRATCVLGTPSWATETIYPTGAANLILLVVAGSVDGIITLAGPEGEPLLTFPAEPVSFVKVIALWAPRRLSCGVQVMAACGECTFEQGRVCYPVGLCVSLDCDTKAYQAWWLPASPPAAAATPPR